MFKKATKLQKFALWVIFIIILTSTGCNYRMQPKGDIEVLQEKWMQQVATNTNGWFDNSGTWLLKRDYKHEHPLVCQKTILPDTDFTDLIIAGNANIQIIAGAPRNAITIYGDNGSANQVSLSYLKSQLTVNTAGDASNTTVRIEAKRLTSILNMNQNTVIGKINQESKINIISTSHANTFLDGEINLCFLENSGYGTVTITGIQSNNLNLTVPDDGNVRLAGRIGIQNIEHDGDGDVSIVGADSDKLSITTYGSGVTSVYGHVNLKQINADEKSYVLVYWADTNDLKVTQKKDTFVGIAGASLKLQADVQGSSCFQGQYLRTGNAFIKTYNTARANVTAGNKIFASAAGSSVILYYGEPQDISKTTARNASILALNDVPESLIVSPYLKSGPWPVKIQPL